MDIKDRVRLRKDRQVRKAQQVYLAHMLVIKAHALQYKDRLVLRVLQDV